MLRICGDPSGGAGDSLPRLTCQQLNVYEYIIMRTIIYYKILCATFNFTSRVRDCYFSSNSVLPQKIVTWCFNFNVKFRSLVGIFIATPGQWSRSTVVSLIAHARVSSSHCHWCHRYKNSHICWSGRIKVSRGCLPQCKNAFPLDVLGRWNTARTTAAGHR